MLTFTGNNFVEKIEDYKVLIDGVTCEVLSATSTEFTCKTGLRPKHVPSTMSVSIIGRGTIPLKGLQFVYTNLWTDEDTWGGEFPPEDGETVYVPPGLNLLVDIVKSPKLYAVIVEGSIIFSPDKDPNHHRTFDASYIFVKNGTMQVGTEENPYTSRITITMHSNVSSPYIPIYGNKVIAVRFGTLDLHGVKRTPTWTTLDTTVQPGSAQITLREAVDWKVGEEIVIAPTSFEVDEAEKRTIL